MMAKITSIHEYKLRGGVASQQFEAAVEDARKAELFSLPGLMEYHFLRHIRGTREVELPQSGSMKARSRGRDSGVKQIIYQKRTLSGEVENLGS